MDKEKLINEMREIIISEGRHHSNERGDEASIYTNDDIETVIEKIVEYISQNIRTL